jgi:hypothetical protein
VKRLLVLSALSLLLVFPAASSAWDLNKDFYNTTGHLANDIEIYLDGTPIVTDHYDGDTGSVFPVFQTFTQQMNGTTRTVLRWSGNSVPPGGKMHVGYTAGGARILGWCWTYNGQPIGPVWQVDLQPTLGGLGIQLRNDLTYTLWPVWPYDPPRYYITGVVVYYFPAMLPLASLNNATLPTLTPLLTNVIVPGGSGLYVDNGGSIAFNDPNPPTSAVSAVWVVGLNTAPAGSNGSTDFVQYNVMGVVPTAQPTWGQVKALYQ